MPTVLSGKNSLFRSEGILLLLLTATVYSSFILREMGYLTHFDIPFDVISVSNVGLAIASKATLFAALAYVFKVNIVWILRPRGSGFPWEQVRGFISFSLIIGFAFYPYLATNLSWWWFVGLEMLLLFFFFIWPLISQKSIAGYRNKFEAQRKIDADSNPDIINSLIVPLGREAYLGIMFMAVILLFAYGTGRKEAMEQEYFFVIDSSPPRAVLRIYGEIVVSEEINAMTRQPNGVISIMKLSSDKPLSIHKKKLGRLSSAYQGIDLLIQ